jgi:hypothetical protein
MLLKVYKMELERYCNVNQSKCNDYEYWNYRGITTLFISLNSIPPLDKEGGYQSPIERYKSLHILIKELQSIREITEIFHVLRNYQSLTDLVLVYGVKQLTNKNRKPMSKDAAKFLYMYGLYDELSFIEKLSNAKEIVKKDIIENFNIEEEYYKIIVLSMK